MVFSLVFIAKQRVNKSELKDLNQFCFTKSPESADCIHSILETSPLFVLMTRYLFDTRKRL